jgi:hypothetical protein
VHHPTGSPPRRSDRRDQGGLRDAVEAPSTSPTPGDVLESAARAPLPAQSSEPWSVQLCVQSRRQAASCVKTPDLTSAPYGGGLIPRRHPARLGGWYMHSRKVLREIFAPSSQGKEISPSSAPVSGPLPGTPSWHGAAMRPPAASRRIQHPSAPHGVHSTATRGDLPERRRRERGGRRAGRKSTYWLVQASNAAKILTRLCATAAEPSAAISPLPPYTPSQPVFESLHTRDTSAATSSSVNG